MWIMTSVIMILTLYFVEAPNSSTRKSYNSERSKPITKSPNDKREYRGLVLTNELKVLLISDPSAEQSAACMVVGVGSLNDPPNVPGLANLVGYVLQMAVKKYPGVYNFHKYIRNHGGIPRLPVTKFREQIFPFAVAHSHFTEALDRFAQFFLKPSLSYEFSDPVINTSMDLVERDYENCKKSDEKRVFEVEKLMSNKKSLYNHFFIGNKETLEFPKVATREKLFPLYQKVKNFHSSWYSSNLMSLTVLGNESLEQLEKKVARLFAKIENKNRNQIEYDYYKNHPFGPEQLKRKIYVTPLLENTRFLRLVFPIPDVRSQYKSAPEAYITYYLILNGHKGSLISVLQKRDLCTDLKVEWTNSAGISFLVLVCNLTGNVSQDRVDHIIQLIFQYIHMLKAADFPEWIFNEMGDIRSILFFHYQIGTPISYVEYLAPKLRTYPFEDILSHNFRTDKWDPNPTRNLLQCISPHKMNVIIVSPAFAEMPDQEKEPYCEAMYKVEEIPETLIEEWNNEERLDPELVFPQPNEFFPKNFDLYSEAMEDMPVSNIPRILHQSSKSEIWFKQDFEFKEPKLWVGLELCSSTAQSGPFENSLWRIFEKEFIRILEEDLHLAKIAYFAWDVKLSPCGIRVQLNGYHDKLPMVLAKILSKITQLGNDLTEERFITMRNKLFRTLKWEVKNDKLREPEWYVSYLLSAYHWPKSDALRSTKLLQLDNMKKFLSRVFRRIFIRGLIHGNCTRERAKELVNIIEEPFQSSRGMLPMEVMLRGRVVELVDGSHFTYQVFNEDPGLYSYFFYFELHAKPYEIQNKVATSLLFAIISSKCTTVAILTEKFKRQDRFSSVDCALSNLQGIRGLFITVRSKERSHQAVDKRVERFLRNIPEMVVNLSDRSFESFKEAVELEDYTRSDLLKLSNSYWQEITNRSYNFDYEMERKALLSLTEKALLDFHKKILTSTSSSQRRKLAIHILPEDIEIIKPKWVKNIPADAVNIEDTLTFRTSSALHSITSSA